MRPTPAKKVVKTLSKIGFEVVRQRGSHLILRHPDGRVTVVPIHAGEDIGRGLLSKIIKDTKISRDQFLKLLEET
ncbi:MAG: type II toxin-antitoxin system HicA family toxin [Candidatus Bathyarchaeia archaeon]